MRSVVRTDVDRLVHDGRRDPARRRTFWRPLALTASAGFAIRLIEVIVTHWGDRLAGDARYYQLQAKLLSQGHVYVEPFAWGLLHHKVESAAHPPLFTFVLAVADWLHLSSVDASRVVCCAIGAVGIVVVGMLGDEIGGRRAGLVAAGIAAVYPVWWITDGLVMAEVLYVPLVAGLLLLAYRLWRRPRLGTAIGLGVLGALAALTRSEGLLLLLLVMVPLLVAMRQLSWRRKVTLLGTTLVTTAVVVAPWVGFNLARFDKPVFMSTNDGATYADSNCPATYQGRFLGGYVFGCHRPTVKEAGDESVVSGKLFHVGLDYTRQHADRVPVVVAARIGRTWGLYNPVDTLNVDSFGKWSARDSWLMLLSFYAVAGLGIAGLVTMRRHRVTIIPFVAALVAVTITVAGFYGIARFRVAGDVTFVTLAGETVDALLVAGVSFASLGSRRRRVAIPSSTPM